MSWTELHDVSGCFEEVLSSRLWNISRKAPFLQVPLLSEMKLVCTSQGWPHSYMCLCFWSFETSLHSPKASFKTHTENRMFINLSCSVWLSGTFFLHWIVTMLPRKHLEPSPCWLPLLNTVPSLPWLPDWDVARDFAATPVMESTHCCKQDPGPGEHGV